MRPRLMPGRQPDNCQSSSRLSKGASPLSHRGMAVEYGRKDVKPFGVGSEKLQLKVQVQPEHVSVDENVPVNAHAGFDVQALS